MARLPLEELATDGGHHWGTLGSRTARVRAVLAPERVRDTSGERASPAVAEQEEPYEGWWSVPPGTPVLWSDGTPAGRVQHTVRWDVEPAPEGEWLCTWWQDLAGTHEAHGVTARWSVHASVLAQTGLRLCFPDSAVRYAPPSPE